MTEYDPGEPLLRGLVLLLLVAAWLWLPRLEAREAGWRRRGGAVGHPGACRSRRRSTATARGGTTAPGPWFGGGKSVTFEWSHEYGPLDWPREGTTLLNVKSDRPHYWKAETLDTFDGLRWIRTRQSDNEGVGADLAFKTEFSPPWDYSSSTRSGTRRSGSRCARCPRSWSWAPASPTRWRD